ncbi:hypothetical protein COOONC_18469 [Cooperia oncophora]
MNCSQNLGSILQYSAVTLTRNTEAKILSIGLGGGAINSLLRHFFPKMDITVVEYNAKMIYMAKKWFGLELDKRQRVVLADGIKFMAKKVDQGSTYDMIILDACDGGFVSTTLVCPAAGFLDNAVIENAARLAGPRGTLFLNALSMRLSDKELEQFMMSRLLKSFHHCTVQRPSATVNQVYSCSQRHLDGKPIEMTKFINITLL